ncbi:MAG: hypothetical protein ACK55I_12360, partial [bacterium]
HRGGGAVVTDFHGAAGGQARLDGVAGIAAVDQPGAGRGERHGQERRSGRTEHARGQRLEGDRDAERDGVRPERLHVLLNGLDGRERRRRDGSADREDHVEAVQRLRGIDLQAALLQEGLMR